MNTVPVPHVLDYVSEPVALTRRGPGVLQLTMISAMIVGTVGGAVCALLTCVYALALAVQ